MPAYPSNKTTFIDLFAGIGGFKSGFDEIPKLAKKKGLDPQDFFSECLLTSEIDKYCVETYKHAFHLNQHHIFNRDIKTLNSEEVPEHDILLAGFPCQAFSHGGLGKEIYDERGSLFFEIYKILANKQPKAFILENVKRLKSRTETWNIINSLLTGTFDGEISKEIVMSKEARHSLSKKIEYDIDFKILSPHEFGIPQKRERIFIIGVRNDISRNSLKSEFEWPIQSEKETKVGSILEKNPDKKYTISKLLWDSHKKRKERNKARGVGFGYGEVNSQSPYTRTLSARYYKDGGEILVKEGRGRPRKLTPNECKNLMGFPSGFKLNPHVSDTQKYKQFGNSVCVPIVTNLGFSLIKYLSIRI